MIATLVDFTALWKIGAIAFGVGVGGVLVWSLTVVSGSNFQEARAGGNTGRVVVFGAGVALGVFVCAAVIVIGIVAMTHK